MALIVVHRKLTKEEGNEIVKKVNHFFLQNPRRRACRISPHPSIVWTFHKGKVEQEIKAKVT